MKIRIISLILVGCMCFGMLFAGQTASADLLVGDVFIDDVVNTHDLLYLRKYLAQLIDFDENTKKKADCNGDQNVDINDVVTIRNYLLKLGDLHVRDGWKTIRDWESDALNDCPSKINMAPSITTVVTELDGYGNRKKPDSKKTLAMKARGLYYENNVNGTNPTCAYNVSTNAPVKIQIIQNNTDTLLQYAKNLRLSMKYRPERDELSVIYIGFSFKGVTNFYYTRVTLESYNDFNYFYFANKEFYKIDMVNKTRRTYLSDENVEKITLKESDINEIKHVCFWMESDKGDAGAPLYVDDIEFYEGKEGYDSSEEDDALPQPQAPVNDGKKRYIAISFDDGPQKYSPTGKHYMEYYLDVANEYNAKFSFFVGAGALDDEDVPVLKRAIEEGHALENHTIGHNRLTSLSVDEGAAKITEVDDWLYEKVGVKTKYIRPPFLDVNTTAYSAMEKAGMKAAFGGPCPQDYNNPSVDYKELYYEKNLGDGVISLNHEHYIDNVETIRRLLEHFTALGYEFVTIDELFEIKGITPKLGKIYYNVYD